MLLARKRGSLSLLHATSFLIRAFFRPNPLFSHTGFLIIQSGCINDHALNMFTLQRLTLVLSLLSGWHPHVQSQQRSAVPRLSCVLIYFSKSWSKHRSMSSRFWTHLYPTASPAAAGSFLCRAHCSFPLPSSCQCPSSGTPPHDVHTANHGNIALEPVPLPLPFRTFRSDSSLSSVSPVSSSL